MGTMATELYELATDLQDLAEGLVDLEKAVGTPSFGPPSFETEGMEEVPEEFCDDEECLICNEALAEAVAGQELSAEEEALVIGATLNDEVLAGAFQGLETLLRIATEGDEANAVAASDVLLGVFLTMSGTE